MVESAFKLLNGKCKLLLLVYQENRFERLGIRVNSNGEVGTFAFEDIV